jgi:hypothetical protein
VSKPFRPDREILELKLGDKDTGDQATDLTLPIFKVDKRKRIRPTASSESARRGLAGGCRHYEKSWWAKEEKSGLGGTA